VLPFEEVEEVELDEMWSFVFSKENQRWLWLALDHQTGQILAYTFGRRKDEVFRTFRMILEPFSISMFYTDDWGSYQRNIPSGHHVISKKNTQTIERKNLTLRTHIKRLCRKSICFSKSVVMHDIVIGLAINVWEFGMVYSANNYCRT
jgi:insertion element IS1 protein InsB